MHPLVHTALAAAEAAARIHLRHFGKVGLGEAREKGPSDYVSRVDTEAQEAAVAVIRSRHPGHGILAEEEPGGVRARTGASARNAPKGPGQRHARLESGNWNSDRPWPSDGSPLWIIDPLDGTTNFLHGHPFFCASVAAWRPRPPTEPEGGWTLEAGAVVAPRTGERWWARRGGGAWKNGLPIRVSQARSLREALVGTGFPFKKLDLIPRYVGQLGRVLPASGGVRRAGSAAMDLCHLAEGILDAFWEEDYLSPWDVAAGLVILREAGGVATRLNGGEIDLSNGSILAAGSSEVLSELGALVRNESRGPAGSIPPVPSSR